MERRFASAAAILAAVLVSGCEGGLKPYAAGPDTVIATAYDTDRDQGVLVHGQAAIAYDPDGCQNWLMDDGVEGYSTPRFDSKTGLPICNDHFAPGAVVRNYQTGSPGVRDYTPRVRKAP